MLEEDIRQRVKEEMSPERFLHVLGVTETATELALRYNADVRKVRLAALLHDIAREWPTEKLLEYAAKVDIPDGFLEVPALLHGPIAAFLAKEWFGVGDKEVADAVTYHTSGRTGMSLVERVVCLADAIEPGRRFPGVDDIRKTAENELTRALAEAMDASIRYLLQKHESIFPLTILARNELWNEVHQTA